MAMMLLCTTLPNRLKLHRSLPSRLKLCTTAAHDDPSAPMLSNMPADYPSKPSTMEAIDYPTIPSGSKRRNRRPHGKSKAIREYLTMIKHHSPVTVSFIKSSYIATLFTRVNICGTLPPHVSTFNNCLRNVAASELQPRIGKPFLARYFVSGVIPDLTTYSLLLRHYCKHHTFLEVVQLVFTQMEPMGVMPDSIFYKSLISRVCAHFGPAYAFGILRELGRRIPMRLLYYDALVGQLSRTRLAKQPRTRLILKSVMIQMLRRGVCPDDKLYDSVLRCCEGKRRLPENSIMSIALAGSMFAQGIRDGTVWPIPAL